MPQPVKPFNFFSWEMLEVIAQHKVPTVVVGWCGSIRPISVSMRQALGYDMRAHFAASVHDRNAPPCTSPRPRRPITTRKSGSCVAK